ncbi:MAG TPA: hypothetical protein VHR66_28550 [Gemmataceae bacterium]|nr:hypothetical protein [Gemmataceae bacterium]
MIQRLNEQFVCTTLTYPEVWQLSEQGSKLARQVVQRWSIPLVLVFLNPESDFVFRLSSLSELNEVHPETTRRTEAPQKRGTDADANNMRVFFEHVDKYFPR